jgi:hypothetical protein
VRYGTDQWNTDTIRRFVFSLLYPAFTLLSLLQVREAAEKALQEYKRDNPDVDDSELKVDLPPARPPPPRMPPPRVLLPPNMPPLPGMGIAPPPLPGVGMRPGAMNLLNIPPFPQQNFNFVVNPPNPNLNMNLHQNFNNAPLGQVPFQMPPQMPLRQPPPIPPQMAPMQQPLPGFQAPMPALYGQPYQQAMPPLQPAGVGPAGRVRRARRNY